MGPRDTKTVNLCGPSATNVSFHCPYLKQAALKKIARSGILMHPEHEAVEPQQETGEV